jgi:hypothetical protein
LEGVGYILPNITRRASAERQLYIEKKKSEQSPMDFVRRNKDEEMNRVKHDLNIVNHEFVLVTGMDSEEFV